MQKIFKILSIRIKIWVPILCLSACSAPPGQQAKEDVGPVSSYARNTLAAENPDGLLRIGEGFERSGDYAGARTLYEQALEADPELTEARIAVARANAKIGNSDEAVADLSLLLSDEPDNRVAKVTLAQIHTNDARYRAALLLMESIDDPKVEEITLIGKLLHVSGREEGGHALLLRALDMAPEDTNIFADAGLSFALVGDYGGAIALLRKSLDSPQVSTRARQGLALVYALSGQRQLALRLARDVLPPEEVQRLAPYFQFLPRFSDEEKAAALFFDRVPNDTLARMMDNATN